MGNSPLNLKTANNTNLSVQGTANLDFSLKYDTEILRVLFVFTKELLENPKLGHNLIEALIVLKKDHKTFETLKSVFSLVALEGAETVLMEKV